LYCSSKLGGGSVEETGYESEYSAIKCVHM
jgi:hypothetical protein